MPGVVLNYARVTVGQPRRPRRNRGQKSNLCYSSVVSVTRRLSRRLSRLNIGCLGRRGRTFGRIFRHVENFDV